MCGISGIFSSDPRKVRPELIERMNQSLFHRGPDGSSYYLNQSNGVALGHQRLKIIDLSENAKQPMTNASKDLWITFNGEIYNFQEIRAELIGLGYSFKSRSDTEVIIHGYAQWQERILEKLNGIFAFAIWDEKKQELFLARDRLGVKPLYYLKNSEGFLFASEIKAIFATDFYKPEVNSEEIFRYIKLRYSRNNRSLFAGIENLEPGHWLRISKSKFEKKSYWDLSFSNENESRLSEAQAIEKVQELLKNSVTGQVISDVPVGVFLSGGLDSSIVAFFASQAKPDLHTFTIGFPSPYENELEYAKQMSDTLKTIHHESICSREDFFEDLSKLVWHRDSPLEVPNEVLIYRMSRELKKYFTVVLSGEGADEVFLGYPKYRRIFDLRKKFKRADFPLRAWMKSTFLGESVDRNILQSEHPDLNLFANYYLGLSFGENLISKSFLKDAGAGYPLSFIEDFFSKDRDFEENVQYFDFKNHLHSLLMRIDRMTMACSVEGRVPFLDHKLVEFVLHQPTSLKLKNGMDKYLLKRSAETVLPGAIVHRKKMGFPVPLTDWLIESKLSFMKETVLDGYFMKSGILNADEVEKFFSQPASVYQAEPLYAEYAWRLFNLELWHQTFFNPATSNIHSDSGARFPAQKVV